MMLGCSNDLSYCDRDRVLIENRLLGGHGAKCQRVVDVSTKTTAIVARSGVEESYGVVLLEVEQLIAVLQIRLGDAFLNDPWTL